MTNKIETYLEIISRVMRKMNVNVNNYDLFNYLIFQYYILNEPDFNEESFYKIKEHITDSKNDGGIDYCYFDEDNNKVIVGQNKYSKNVNKQDCLNEISKTLNTVTDFLKGNSSKYNVKLKEILQNNLDRLSEEDTGNIEIVFTSLSDFDKSFIYKKIDDFKGVNEISKIVINNVNDLSEIINKTQEKIDLVTNYILDIDTAKNSLFFSTSKEDQEGVIVNVSSKSLQKLYNKYQDNGLFDYNIRGYINNKTVDDGIKNTLDNNRNDFWFLNNGLTIVCKDYMIDGNNVKLYDFSIVNGGQTTYLIGTYKGNNDEEFFIPTKIIKYGGKNIDDNNFSEFCNKIAEATNSQKPISPRDLRANDQIMIRLKNILNMYNIDLSIKRGKSKKNVLKNPDHKLSNEVFAQIYFSFVYQCPGIARSNKKSLFTNNSYYRKVFKNDFNEENRNAFIIDLIDLNTRFDIISKKQSFLNRLGPELSNIFKNAKMVIFALFGLCYRIANGQDKLINELINDINLAKDLDIDYHSFISNYKNDDIDNKIENLVFLFVEYLNYYYEDEYEKGNVTSPSNFFKTDKKYLEFIVPNLFRRVDRKYSDDGFPNLIEIFCNRKNKL